MKMETSYREDANGVTLVIELACASREEAETCRSLLPVALDTYQRAKKALDTARLEEDLARECRDVRGLTAALRAVEMLEGVLGIENAESE